MRTAYSRMKIRTFEFEAGTWENGVPYTSIIYLTRFVGFLQFAINCGRLREQYVNADSIQRPAFRFHVCVFSVSMPLDWNAGTITFRIDNGVCAPRLFVRIRERCNYLYYTV